MGVSPNAKVDLCATPEASPRCQRRQRASVSAKGRASRTAVPPNAGTRSEGSNEGPNGAPSVLLRRLLAENPRVKRFTVQQLVAYMGRSRPEASLMLLSVPGMIPIPNTSDLVGSPTMMIAGQMMAGRKTVRLPRHLRQRSVPRRALAIAIHTVLPILERAEKLTKERWHWACTPAAKRVLGVLVFLIALPLALPFLGVNIPHAASLFTISVGMMEKDGLAIALGVAIGMTSLILLTGKNLLPSTLGRKAAVWFKDIFAKVTNLGHALKCAMRCTLRWVNERIFGCGHFPQAGSSKAPREAPRLTRDLARADSPQRGLSNPSFQTFRLGVPSFP